jgi:hypothetical protein
MKSKLVQELQREAETDVNEAVSKKSKLRRPPALYAARDSVEMRQQSIAA